MLRLAAGGANHPLSCGDERDFCLDAVEKAIRSALEKGNADDRAFREGVYRKAFAALERAIEHNPGITLDVAERRRASVKGKIAEIESEFIPAFPSLDVDRRHAPRAETPRIEPAAPPVEAATPRVEPAVSRRPEPTAPRVEAAAVRRVEPEAPRVEPAAPAQRSEPADPNIDVSWGSEPRRTERSRAPEIAMDSPAARPAEAQAAAPTPSVESNASGPVPQSYFPNLDDFGPPGTPPVGPEDVGPDEVSTGGGPNVARERRRPFAALFLGATLIAAIGIGVWWGMSTGLFKTPEEIDSSVPNPPVTTEEEDFDPDEENNAPQLPGEADAQRNWVTVFSPSDPTSANAPSGTSADVMEDDTGSFIRIRSTDAGSTVAFDVGQGILERLAGKQATFNVVARSEEGKETQFAVDCNFGELGDCGRKRYAAGYAKGDFLFEIEMPQKAPGAGGTIAINSDITNGGKALDIYEIRVSTN